MMNARRTILLFCILLLTSIGFAAPDEPHRMFGEVTDEEGESLETEVLIEYEGDEVTSFETNSDGSYDIMIPNGDYENEELDLIIEGEVVETVVFEPLGVTEKDLSYQSTEENQEEQTDEEDTGGSGGGGGGLPSDYGEENSTTEENQTDDDNTKSSTDSPAQEENGSEENTVSQEEEVREEENTSIADSSEENADESNSLITGRFFQEQTNSVTILLLLGIMILAVYIGRNSSHRYDVFN
ncbi:hypothetical protein HRED_05973 [Candidatus Haloredivivus sp. G17]|nr:hypothetical protein HRED_05973 [Candidatus Haloredivivus sp. G17]